MPTYAATVMADAPVAYWRLGETSGSAVDLSGQSNTGTYVGSASRGQAGAIFADINGSVTLPASPASYVSVPDAASLRTPSGNSWSMEAWIRPTAPSGLQCFIRKDASGGAYFVRLSGTSINTLWAMPAGANAQLTGGTVTANVWNHVVATYDGANIRHYVNGAQVAVQAETRTLTFNNAVLVLGNQGLGTGEQFVGGLDEVAIYNSALSAARVLAHYEAGRVQVPSQTQAFPGTVPPPTVEVAFASVPLASSPSWTDITRYVRSVSIRRGRDFELARYPSGTCNVLLDNRDRRFDPTYTFGAYYPYVIPGRRIRVRAGSNLLGNASLEVDASGWFSVASTIVRDASTAMYGTASLKVTTTNVAFSGANLAGRSWAPTPVSVTPGQAYTFSWHIRRGAAGSTSMIAQIEWYTAADAQISLSQQTFTLSSTAWSRSSLTATAPTTAAYASVTIFTQSASGVFDFYVDAWQLETGSVARIYHDAVGTLYDGFVESWPQDWDPPKESRTTLQAADAFKMLQLRKLPGGYSQRILADAPLAYWRFDEQTGATVALDSSGNGNNGGYANSPPLGVAGALKGDSNTAVTTQWVSGSRYVYSTDADVLAARTAFSIETWFKTAYVPTNWGAILTRGQSGNPGAFGLWFVYPGTPFLRFQILTTTGTHIVDTPFGGNTGNWVYFCGTWDGATLRMYIDQWFTVSAAAGGTFAADTSGGLHWGVQSGGSYFVGDCSFDETAYYTYALSAAQVAAHQSAGSGIFNAQTSPQRVTAVLDAVRWPSNLRVTYGGTEPVQTVALTSATSLQHLQDVADAEAGRIFMDAQGRVRLDGRDVFFVPPFTDTKATFGDNPLALDELPYADLQAAYDDTQVWNDVRLTRAGGLEQGVQDAGSIDAYGQRTMQTSNMLNTSDVNMLSLAQYRLSQYKQPQLRFVQMTLRPGTNALEWEQVLERDIADRVRVGRTPQGIAPPIAFDCWIEGIEHDIRPGFWETRWKLSRADAQTYWILDDATKSVLGTSTFLSF